MENGLMMEEAKEKMNHLGGNRIPFFFMIDFDQGNAITLPTDKIDERTLLYSINGNSNAGLVIDLQWPEKVAFEKHPIPFHEYQRQFNIVAEHLHRGDTYLVNLTCSTPIETNLTLYQVFHKSQVLYKLWCRDKLVVFSPETFVQIQGNKIFSYPMKGTIDAAIPKAREVILNNEKEAAEHATIVDLIRNDLSMVADHVQVDEYRFIDSIKTHQGELLQVSSKISGVLPNDFYYRLGDIIFTLLPAGSISGAPKTKTIEIIKKAETYHRGFYTGIFGFFDGQNLDSAVMIRFIEQTDKGLVFKSGGGITSQSNARDEYHEMVRKVYLPF
jgi:para-aminobenzoate synthetase component I